MTRKKVKLTYITDNSARKATFKKRKKGLMKKVSELSTLCDINTCIILYKPCESQPEVWPCTSGVQRVLQDFRMLSEMDKSKKMMNQETFLKQQLNKVTQYLKRQHKDNHEKEITEVMFQYLDGRTGLQHLTITDLYDLNCKIEQYLKNIHHIKETQKEADKRLGMFE